MPIKRIVKNWTWVRDLNRYRKYVKYVRRHYKSDGRHSLVDIMCAVNRTQKRQLNSKEFCYFRYMDLTAEEQRNIVPWGEQIGFYERVNTPAGGSLLCNKYSTYERFKDYYQREVCYMSGGQESDKKEFISFARKNVRIVVKPIDANKGYGVRMINAQKLTDGELESVLNG